MKYDLSRTPSRSAKRVLGALSDALFAILLKKPFEELTVGEICDESGYPRATFYNYFDDKYDLLNFYWYIVFRQVKLEECSAGSIYETIDECFERLYEMLNENKRVIKKLFVYNKRDGYFVASCKSYLASIIKIMLNKLLSGYADPVPPDIISEHIANTLLLVFGKHFENPESTKEQTKLYLDTLLKR